MCQVQRGRKVLGRVPDRDQGLLPLAQEGGGQEERGHEEAHLACRGLRDPRRCQGRERQIFVLEWRCRLKYNGSWPLLCDRVATIFIILVKLYIYILYIYIILLKLYI